jgi:DNA-binding response OmpR family regulator
VEDHDDTRITLARLLKRKGHEVLSAGSVSSALIVARAREFDLLISDIGLPDGDGFELLQQLPPTRAISLSGFGMEKDVAASKAAGFAAHLTKPVNFEQLATTINELLSEGT